LQELKSLQQSHSKLHLLQIDLKDFDKYGEIVKQVEEVTGSDGLNVLFNSAGVSPRSSFLGLRALKASELLDTFSVNCVAPLMLTKAFIPLLKKAAKANKSAPLGVTRAVVVNMSSILGSIETNVDGSLYHYRVTKSGINAATKSMSIDLKNDGIMAVSMHPGWVKTDMGGEKAPMEVEESCEKMIETIYGLDASKNGGFIQYDGSSLPW
jgi:NAD(P)-dependent dehydrogenase (short-subunit alcohol dehydrogenase family)